MTLNIETYINAQFNPKLPVTLQLTGNNLPSELTLSQSGIEIEYQCKDNLPSFNVPIFSFTFFGDNNILEQFGTITTDSHKFSIIVNGETYWDGYLKSEVYSIINDGYENNFTINGVGVIEHMKDVYIDRINLIFLNKSLITITEYIQAINNITGYSINNVWYIGNYVTDFYNLKVNIENWFDDEGKPSSYYDILEAIALVYNGTWIEYRNRIQLVAFDYQYKSNTYNNYTYIAGDNTLPALQFNHKIKTVLNHLSTNENLSIDLDYNKATVIASDYTLDVNMNTNIPWDNLKLEKSLWKGEPGQFRCWRDKEYFVGFVGTVFSYYRKIFSLPENSKWRFLYYKYISDDNFNLASEKNGIYSYNDGYGNFSLRAGIYPYQWLFHKDDDYSANSEEVLMVSLYDGRNSSPAQIFNNDAPLGGQPFAVFNSNENIIVDENILFFINFEMGISNYNGEAKYVNQTQWELNKCFRYPYKSNPNGTCFNGGVLVQNSKITEQLKKNNIGIKMKLSIGNYFYTNTDPTALPSAGQWVYIEPGTLSINNYFWACIDDVNYEDFFNRYYSMKTIIDPPMTPFIDSSRNGMWIPISPDMTPLIRSGNLIISIESFNIPIDSIYIFLKNFEVSLFNLKESEKRKKEDNVYTNIDDNLNYKYVEYPDTTFKITSKNDSILSRSKLINQNDEQIDTLLYYTGDRQKPELKRIECILNYVPKNRTYEENIELLTSDNKDNFMSKIIFNSDDYSTVKGSKIDLLENNLKAKFR
jgi:hypothetical protein